MTTDRDEHEWERGWEGHERAQRARLAQLTFAQKLQWLEQAHTLVRQFAQARVRAAAKAETDARNF